MMSYKMVFHQRGIAIESTDEIFGRKFSWRLAVFSENKQVEEPIQWMSCDLFFNLSYLFSLLLYLYFFKY